MIEEIVFKIAPKAKDVLLSEICSQSKVIFLVSSQDYEEKEALIGLLLNDGLIDIVELDQGILCMKNANGEAFLRNGGYGKVKRHRIFRGVIRFVTFYIKEIIVALIASVICAMLLYHFM